MSNHSSQQPLKDLNINDPLKRSVNKQEEKKEWSPFDPPPAYSPPKKENVRYEEYLPFIQKLVDEHRIFEEKLTQFETTLLTIQKEGFQKGYEMQLSDFFYSFDNDILKHQRKEEDLFPLLKQKLLESGEHSKREDQTSATDVMEADHIRSIQSVAVVFNLLGLAMRLPDQKSRLMTLDLAIEQGKVLVEEFRLHSFREDNIIFPLVHKYQLAKNMI